MLSPQLLVLKDMCHWGGLEDKRLHRPLLTLLAVEVVSSQLLWLPYLPVVTRPCHDCDRVQSPRNHKPKETVPSVGRLGCGILPDQQKETNTALSQ